MYAYAADQAFPRGGDKDAAFGARWRRPLHLTVPVRQPERWDDPRVRRPLAAALSFLSEDEYCFDFVPRKRPTSSQRYLSFSDERFAGVVDEVLLFSGGLDSLAGAATLAAAGRQALLVNHRSTPKAAPVLRHLVRELGLRGRRPLLLPVRAHKAQGLTRDSNQRARSFLYAALACVVADMVRLDRVSFYENGVVSINLPPATQVVGSRATRTTHPRALRLLGELFTALLGRPFAVDNPFRWKTRTDILRELDGAGFADLIAHARSCAKTHAASNAQPHCGACSQCLDRRFAVLAAGLERHDPAEGYRVELFRGERQPGPEQTMLAVYVEMANQIGRMSAAQFFRRFGEAVRVLGAYDGPADGVAQEVYHLYRRHAVQVNGVIEAELGRSARGLRERTLPPTCLLRMVSDGGVADTAPAAPQPADTGPGPENVFRSDGRTWQVRYAGRDLPRLLRGLGMSYLHALLRRPGVALSSAELERLVKGGRARAAGGGAGAVMGPEEREGLAREHRELAAAIDRARRDGDEGELDRLREEQRRPAEQVARDTGLGGRTRRLGGPAERARKAVGNAIRRAIREIRADSAALADHLTACVDCGGSPRYAPPPGVEWQT